MSTSSRAAEINDLLRAIESGDFSARDRLIELTYDELRDIAARAMRHERQCHTLQPTALISEAVIRLFKKSDTPGLPSLPYFYGAMARAMKRILVDYARGRDAQRRGGHRKRVPMDDTLLCLEDGSNVELLALDEALNRLKQHEARIYEVVVLRFFGGMEHKQIAEELGVSLSTVDRDWRFARAWLNKELNAFESDGHA